MNNPCFFVHVIGALSHPVIMVRGFGIPCGSGTVEATAEDQDRRQYPGGRQQRGSRISWTNRAFCKSNYRLVRGFRGATTSFACWRSRLSPALTPPSADLGTRPPSLRPGTRRCRRAWPSDILGLRGPRTAPPGPSPCVPYALSRVPVADRIALRDPLNDPRVATERLPRCCAQDMVAPLESTLIFAKCSSVCQTGGITTDSGWEFKKDQWPCGRTAVGWNRYARRYY
jgi:hypothetical protein